MNTPYMTADQFYPKAKELRAVYDRRMANPKEGHAERFVWDYWHVPDQYTLLRTPAYNYFPEEDFKKFEEFLIEWGQKNLGCFGISPTWLSCYVDGCKQDFHADLPHGPWAFVFSLCDWQNRNFRGGETFLLKPQILNFWHNMDNFDGLEKNQVLENIEPEFNRLTVFDPRYPHGVHEVRGSKDPREGRLVIHGWFTEPRPFIDGSLSEEEVSDALNDQLPELFEKLDQVGPHNGLASFSFDISPLGKVEKLKSLSQTVIPTSPPSISSEEVKQMISKYLLEMSFPQSAETTHVTLPIVFE